MRALVLTTIITVTGGGLTALAACGGTETTSGPTDSGSESSSGSSGRDGQASSSGDSGNSSSGDGGACNTLTQQGQNVTAQLISSTLPTGSGGTVQNGTYVLTRAIGHLAFPITPPNLGAITIRITGTNADAITTTPQGASSTHSGSFTTNGNNFSLMSTCTTSNMGNGLQFMGTYTYGMDASATVMSIHIQYDYGGFMVPATAEFTKQ